MTREQLLRERFLANLSEERRDGPSAADGLQPEWRKVLYDLLRPHEGAEVSGSTETFSDSPSQSDRLGRRAFADVLAARIERLRANEPSSPIVIHLDGPWGSGKSTVLNLLEDVLKASPPTRSQGWLVVRYNAWQQQRFESPWWVLTERLVSQGARDLARRGRIMRGLNLRLRHYYFRVFSGRIWVLVAGLLTIGAGVALYRLASLANVPSDSAAKTIASSIKDLLSVAAAVFGVIVATSRFLMASDTTAQDYLKSRPDPIGELAAHLREVFKDIDQKIAIFVDDIDRCEVAAVVKTLEGIHIVFTAIPVVFVVAGDGRWIERAFEKAYGEAAPTAAKASVGQTVGGLFIEKLFQISATVPRMPPPVKEAFWKQLLGIGDPSSSQRPHDGQTSEISGLMSEEDILEAVSAVDVRLDPKRALKLREDAMRRLVAPDLIERPTRHVLEVLRDSIEANPRAMKRHVMAYGMARATDLASFRNTPQETLATWSVLSMRWPVLARWLADDPKRLMLRFGDHPPGLGLSDEDSKFLELMRSAPVARLLAHAENVKAFEAAIGADLE